MITIRVYKLLALFGLLLALVGGHTVFAHSETLTPEVHSEVVLLEKTGNYSVAAVYFYDVKTRKKIAIEKPRL